MVGKRLRKVVVVEVEIDEWVVGEDGPSLPPPVTVCFIILFK